MSCQGDHRGERNKNCQGEYMSILNYRSSKDIDVIFEKDNSVKSTTYPSFLAGLVRRNELVKTNYVGLPVIDEDNYEAKIVEVLSEDDVTVQYLDGSIVYHLTLGDVLNARFNKKGEPYALDEESRTIKWARDMTKDNVRYLLNKFGYAVMIRPCGFGKTVAGLSIFYSKRYQRCLFLHPYKDDLNAEKIEKSQSNKVIHSRTFNWLYGLTPEKIASLDYDIVFIDEIHRIGGTEDKGAIKTYKAIKTLMETHPKTHFLGATATPERSDGIDVIGNMFHGHYCFPYTQENGFQDGILKKPYYYYCSYSCIEKIRDSIKNATKITAISRQDIKNVTHMTDDQLEELDVRYMSKHIKDACEERLPSTRYMRFIAFYLKHVDIEDNKEKVISWFKEAFPNHQIGITIVTSRSDEDLKTVDNLPTEPTEPGYEGRIDLIFNCEMLCGGYHSEHITGLIMDRKTSSYIKYMQIMGRILSFDTPNPVLVFDIVDNLHSDFLFAKNANTSPFSELQNEKVVPIFEEPMTYETLIRKYPHATDWSIVKRSNRKAKESEKIINQLYEEYPDGEFTDIQLPEPEVNVSEKIVEDVCHNSEPIYPVTQDIDRDIPSNTNDSVNAEQTSFSEESPVPTEKPQMSNQPKSQKDTIKEAVKNLFKINKEKPSFAEVADYLANSVDEISAETLQNTNDDKTNEYKPAYMPYGGVYKTAAERKPSINKEVPTSNRTAHEKEYGYPEYRMIYNSDTERLFKNVILINKIANFEEEFIKPLVTEHNEERYKRIIEKWHTLPGCEENYKTYSEVDTKSDKYKLLAEVASHIECEPHVELVLRYMIEGVA